VTPDGWSAALAFLLFVAPGIVFDLLSRRRRVEVDESAFREASRIALWSLLFSLPASAIVVYISTRVHRVTRVAGRLASGDVVPISADGLTILLVMLAELVLACGIAGITHLVLSRRSKSCDIRLVSAWTKAFRFDRPADHDVYVRAKLTSGSVWTGRVVSFTPDLELENRELVLAPPLFSRGKTGDLTPLSPDYHRVVLPASQIASLNVAYYPSPVSAEHATVNPAERPKLEAGKPNGNGDSQARTEASQAGLQAKP
jgi:hypothetical protein